MNDDGQTVLDALAALAPETVPDADDVTWLANFRYQTALLRSFSGPSEPLSSVTLRILAGVPTRIYRPEAAEGSVLFHIHGGGGIAGSLDVHDPVLRRIALRTGWTVMAPEYRLAPEHRFPAQLDDCYSAFIAAQKEAPSRFVVSGDSIGATLATALAVRVRDTGGPDIDGQILFYPNTDLRRAANYRSRDSEDGKIIAGEDLERQIDLYLTNEADRHNPQVSPILVETLAGLPAALVFTGENDPLRDEGEAYAQRLRDVGLSVAHYRLPDTLHAFLQMAGRLETADAALVKVRRWLDDL